MKTLLQKSIGIALGLVLFFQFSAQVAMAENVRVSRPTAANLELFGRGLLYTVSIDQMLAEELAAGIGFGSVGLKRAGGGDLDATAKLLPVYVNYYFMPEQGSIFATLAASLIINASESSGNRSTIGDVIFSSAGVQPSFGVGYENRSETGLVLRVAGYGIIAKELKPWFGVSLGYAF